MKKRPTTTGSQGPQPEKCAVCTTPTRCGSPCLGDKGPHCVGRSDSPDTCDCLSHCGDDPWLKDGRSKPCIALRPKLLGEAMDRHSGGATWIFSVPPHHACRIKLVQVVAGLVPESRRESPLHNGFYVWLESWDLDACCWRLIVGSISSGFQTREAAHKHASHLWEMERLK